MLGKTELKPESGQEDGNTQETSTLVRKPWPAAKRWALPAAAFLGCWLLTSVSVFAQISPGPLSRPHRSLNGAANCATCHKFGGQAALKCLQCHTEIASRLAAHKGLHATYNIPPNSNQEECARCHSEHNGESFPLINWNTKTFDHKLTGYVLEGKHAGLECNKCHMPSHIAPQEKATIKDKDLSRSFLGVSTACLNCHEDFHKGRLGQNCAACHNFEDWTQINIGPFDHSKTRYPLTGLHAQVKCEKCHTNGPDGKRRWTGIPFKQCDDCHQDPHHGSFKQTCESCHTTAGWKKTPLETINEQFDHSKTKYPLEGKHATVECEKCHANGDFKKEVAFAKCTNCHLPDPHKGQFAKRKAGIECSGCHTVQGWKPSTFTVKDHATSAYPLEGGHARVECDQCHIPKGKDTLFKVKFEKCTDCHIDRHSRQFVAAPYFNACDKCHNLEGYKPSTFTLVSHKKTKFALTGAHIAVPCADCHKESAELEPKSALYHWKNLECTSCHEDVHKGQFKERMQQKRADGSMAGCEACHGTKSWKELSGFDHSKTKFPLVGAHRATACIDCHKPPNLETNMLHVDFTAAPLECEDCHEDIHGKQFAKSDVTRCAECHNSMKWKPSTFDHDKRTEFPLKGAHQNVRCGDCHKLTKVVAEKTVLFYKPCPKDCVSCHGPTIPTAKTKPAS